MTASTALTVGNLTVDPRRYTVTYSGKSIKLTPTEFKLLELLVRQHGSIVGLRSLLSGVWGEEYTAKAIKNTPLRNYINRLRVKLDASTATEIIIENHSHTGYRLYGREHNYDPDLPRRRLRRTCILVPARAVRRHAAHRRDGAVS